MCCVWSGIIDIDAVLDVNREITRRERLCGLP